MGAGKRAGALSSFAYGTRDAHDSLDARLSPPRVIGQSMLDFGAARQFLGEHGRHLLTVRDGKADCVPTDREPDLSLDVSDLGSVYLGGTAPSTLVRAGHVRAHRPGAAALADALFHAERPPHCLHWF